MKKVLFILALICLSCNISLRADTELFSTDFSDASWSGITSICNASNAADETHNGITFHSYNSSAKPFTVNQSAGTMTWCNNNMNNNYWIAIPVSGVNGSITITISNGSSSTRFNYNKKQETSISGSPGSGSSSSSGSPSSATITSLTASDYVVYLGRQGSGLTTIKSITITTPCEAPSNVEINGTWLPFAGEALSLTTTVTGGKGTASYQWYKGGTAEGYKIAGATSATYTKAKCAYEDAGSYYCKVSTGDGCDKWSDKFDVKVLRMSFTSGRGGGYYGSANLVNSDPTHHIATCMIRLGGGWDYAFTVEDGNGHAYGQNNPESNKMESGNGTEWWTMNSTSVGCLMRTISGAYATYTFYVDYTSVTEPKVAAVYPVKNQTAGKIIYFDNDVLNWNNLHYRIGHSSWTTKAAMTLVPGTANLYKYTTTDWDNLEAWHIANNFGWSDGNSIFKTKTGDDYAITRSIEYEGGAVTQNVVTITPSTSHSTGGEDQNNNCEFYSYSMMLGMKTQNVSITAPEHGTVTVSYTDIDNSSKSFSSGNRDLAHTCILTITGEPECGYRLSSIVVNGTPISGSTHILSSSATITATFEEDTYSVTLHPDGGTINSGNVTSYTFGVGATLPTDVTWTGKEFLGWYDNAGCTGTPVTAISSAECSNKEYWSKWFTIPDTKFQYVLGYCYVKDGMWTQGSDGSFEAWKYVPGVNVASGTLKATSDISHPSMTAAVQYYNTKDLSKLDVTSNWGTSSSSDRAIKAFKVGSGSTVTFDLGALEAIKITFYIFPASDDAYSIDLTVNGVTENKPIAASQKNKWHKFSYGYDSFTGTFSIKSNSKETRCVVVLEVPAVQISFNANGGSGSMAPILTSSGEEVELYENEFVRDGYRFAGWTLNPAGTGEVIADKAMFSSTTDVTLYAKWEERIFTTITFDATGAYNAYTHTAVAEYGEAMPEIPVLPLHSSLIFDGYYDKPDGAGTQYYTGLGTGVRNWDKTSATATLYAKWLAPCDLRPTLTNVTPIATIWDQQYVDEGLVRLSCEYDTTGISYSLLSAVPSEPITGCIFEYFDEQIHIMGTPNLGNTSTKTVTVTFTIQNNCSPASTYTITQTIRIYPENQKPRIAFIVTGSKDGAFTAFNTNDRDACSDLLTYLSTYYDITCVNGYATKDENAIADYYKDFDLMVITDFLNTGEGYTNVLGTMIDKKPILSFEAYVANLSNWHIGSNPKDPSPKVQDMKVLCAGHAIFKDAKYNPGDASETEVVRADTTVHVLSSLSSAKKAKGLQGFTINEAPDFIFLATVRDANNNRDLIVCCERQMVFQARLLLYGINFYEMGNLSNAGKIIMRQMIDYLLMTDETKVADCSLVFDNNDGDHLWSNPKNWAPGYNIIPTPYHPTRIIAECHVNIDNAHAGSVKVNQGFDKDHNVVDGKLIVMPYGGLTVAGMVAKVNDTRYASPTVIKAEDLLIKADETGNGAFVYGNKESDVRATVEYYSLGENSNTANPVWQYMGVPFQPGQTAIKMYHAAWMCRWSETTTDGLGGLWQWVRNEDVLLPFEGYCITQAAKKTYTNAGKLNAPVTRTLTLDNCDGDGFAFAANSWTAPIKIQEMQDADFTNAERTIYIYHTGSYKNWQDNGTPVDATTGKATLVGQYAVVPIHSSPYIAGADSVIPSMQGFFIKTTAADASLKLVYNRVVYDSKLFKTSTQPMRAPRRENAAPQVMRLLVSGEASGGDQVHLLARGGFTDEYEDGWDGRKIEGDAAAPKLAVVKEGGEMAVAALPSFEDRYLSFRAGEDINYTFCFDYDGDEIYLYDLVTEQATLIKKGNTYTFSAVNKTPQKRFLITSTPPRVATDVESIDAEQMHQAEKFIQEGQLRILHRGIIYDALGDRVSERKEAQP